MTNFDEWLINVITNKIIILLETCEYFFESNTTNEAENLYYDIENNYNIENVYYDIENNYNIENVYYDIENKYEDYTKRNRQSKLYDMIYDNMEKGVNVNN